MKKFDYIASRIIILVLLITALSAMPVIAGPLAIGYIYYKTRKARV